MQTHHVHWQSAQGHKEPNSLHMQTHHVHWQSAEGHKNSHVHRESPGKFESNNLTRDNLGREIGRTSGRKSWDILGQQVTRSIWGFGYKLTNYKLMRKPLTC